MKKFLIILGAGLLLAGCGNTESNTGQEQPVEDAEATEEATAAETEETVEADSTYLTAEEFIERVENEGTYGSYSANLLLWVSAQEARFMETIFTDKEEYGAHKVDIVVVQDGVVAVGFDGEEIVGTWTFDSIDELKEAVAIQEEE
ncbi:hypothetical protein [Alkalihalobacillus sp. LMS39]|uniref:hypothetical protein n=1 Tax=Alkalihalobacillus sp. LMS39 TaxID=2924032 RepID=UPI001FB1A631|nr:hypothetical protein [Alkalihalobacillus sp. LMS39]UOE96192.1 hypothetical protein MM271_11570 [Alkalihalobacillus sp. LMS39]